MAYNNMYPMGYQSPMYYQPQYQNTPNNQNSGIIWVQGEAGAKSYLVAPNTTVQLWDSEEQVIYLKSADASGMPSIKTLDYKVREANVPTHTNTTYATKDELDQLKESIEARLKEITGRSTVDE